MLWSTIEDDLPAVVQTATRIGALQVQWKDASDGTLYRDPDFCNISVVSVETVGPGERRRVVNASDYTERVYALRRVTLQFDFESNDQPFRAMKIADDFCAGLYSTEASAALEALELGVAAISAPRSIPYRDSHDRMRSATVVEVVFNTHTTVTMGEIDFIDTVTGEGTVDTITVPFTESLP